ncbi:MAG: RNA polymerase subunit sigma-70 [Phycisphaerales bacterium]|nr:RNA polymerase subunit sigma-70 [Phycisphaerales bacterium]MCB9863383.1 RNA polymerase subunit sigma-70 [Phycisphaerales bacterium]
MSDTHVTQLIERARIGDRTALPELVDALQFELRQMASAHMRRERSDHTLQTTALINEAYLRLVRQDPADWECRRYFLAAAAQAMRRVLLHHARDRSRQKRGGDWGRVPWGDGFLEFAEPSVDLLALEEALERLEQFDPDKVRLVEMRFFAGMTVEEVAAAMHSSTATVKREWAIARAWLYRELHDGEAAD